jgi:hypothetical protein
LGASPSQEQKCLSSGHLFISVPIAARSVWAIHVAYVAGGVGRGGGLLRGGFEAGFHDGEGMVDLGVTCAELGGIEIKQRQRLLEDKELLLTPRAIP